MAISAPLDRIPALPSIAVGLLIDQINKAIGKIQKAIEDTISAGAKLPDSCDCDDPRIQDLLERIKQIQKMVAAILKILPIIDKIVKLLKTLLRIANAIKVSIFFTPIVGQAALLSELVAVQNMLLANAGTAVKQLSTIPTSVNTSLQSTLANLANVAINLSSRCGDQVNGDGSGGDGSGGGNGDQLITNQDLQNAINAHDFSDSVPETPPAGKWELIDDGGDGDPIDPKPGVPPSPRSPYTDANGNRWAWNGEIDPSSGVGWGTQKSRTDDAEFGSEFYTEINVGMDDMLSRLDSIQEIVDSQQDLLTSLQEAPAQSYSGKGGPKADLGKSGDYYLDTTTSVIYGPKNNNGWPTPVKY